MHKHLSKQAALLLLCSMAAFVPATAADAPKTSEDALRILGSRLGQIRASWQRSVSYDDPRVDVTTLRGLTRRQIVLALDRPDGCRVQPVEPGCMTQRRWTYWFYRLPPGTRGGGPELHIVFDAQDRVQEAMWWLTE